ncbi:lysostaphin resistance A-like protein [Halomicrococcus sp. SG-WS-1]|uniref:CPBP family intramembrane glutamic endopeptidase n=1 Tax=Halomicrococcus sp. SG-WS-1 TaxID=3439057 RepID=UPI003F7A0471
MSSIEDRIRDHPVAAFALLTYAGAWTLDFGVLVLGMEPSWTRWILSGFLSALMPTLAAAVVVYVGAGNVRAWARQIIRWRVHPRWYLAAVGLPIVITIGAITAATVTGGPLDFGSFDPLDAGVTIIIGTLLGAFIGGGQEEAGWRGFPQPHLQDTYGAFRGSIIVGVLWGGWHLPLFLDPTAPHAQWSSIEQTSYFVGIVGFSVLLTWLYNSSGASVLLVMIMHGADNAVSGLVPIDVETVIVEGIVRFDLLWSVYVGHAVTVWILVVLLVAIYGARTLSANSVPTPESVWASNDH